MTLPLLPTPPDGASAPRRLPPGRLLATVLILLVSAAGVGGYLVHERQAQQALVAAASPVARTTLTSVLDSPHVVFRSTALGPTYGKVAMVPLSDPSGPRAVTDVDCDRVYASTGRYVCLAASRGVLTTYSATLLDAALREARALPLRGIPSRTRLSRDGSLAATTTFISGHDYVGSGFSTQTLVTRLATGKTEDLESFSLMLGGHRSKARDRNLWGVTFADDDRFFATASTGGKTYLVRGSLAQRRMESLHTDAECPSLSPDGTRLVYKKRGRLPPGSWRLTGYDLASGTETPLAETRSVDDQVEWLDDQRVVYGLRRTGSAAAVSDVWAVAADGSGTPQVLVPQAWSPAVVR